MRVKNIIVFFVLIILFISLVFIKNIKEKNGKAHSTETFSSYDEKYPLIDDNVFKKIKEIYSYINFSSEFKIGNLENYTLYKEQYKKLLNGEISFSDKLGNDTYIYNYGYLSTEIANLSSNLETYVYYYFDIDNDDLQELVVYDQDFFYVFDYDISNDKFVLWFEAERSYINIIGTRWIVNKNNFIYLDKNGDYEYYFRTKGEGYTNNEGVPIYTYFLTLPQCEKKSEEIVLLEQEYGVFDSDSNLYFFRVNEEQFDILINKFYKETHQSNINIKDITFSYKELFTE